MRNFSGKGNGQHKGPQGRSLLGMVKKQPEDRVAQTGRGMGRVVGGEDKEVIKIEVDHVGSCKPLPALQFLVLAKRRAQRALQQRNDML